MSKAIEQEATGLLDVGCLTFAILERELIFYKASKSAIWGSLSLLTKHDGEDFSVMALGIVRTSAKLWVEFHCHFLISLNPGIGLLAQCVYEPIISLIIGSVGSNLIVELFQFLIFIK